MVIKILANDLYENNTEKKIFNLENFYQFYEALLTFAFVEGSELVGPLRINKIQNKKRKSTKSKSLLYDLSTLYETQNKNC
jgi:hypothetical protein